LVGFFVGILAAIMGVGGGFIMVPAMIYLLGMPTKVVVGTSLFQIIFVTGFATLMHATTNYTVDMVLAVLLLVGGVVGAQIGTRLGTYLKAEQLRILLAIMVLAVCGKLAFDLLVMPAELYTLGGRGRRIDPAVLILAAWVALTAAAVAETVVAGLSRDAISITTNFEGSEILIFGAVSRFAPPPDGSELHVVVTVEGPPARSPCAARIGASASGSTPTRSRSTRPPPSTPWHHRRSGHRDDRDRGPAPPRVDPDRDPGRGHRCRRSGRFHRSAGAHPRGEELYQLNEGTVTLRDETLFDTSSACPRTLSKEITARGSS
jgi:hypothetical protein